MFRLLAVLPMLIVATGCVRSAPLISHAHVGHALTAWHDTPNRQGLFKVAEKEADGAMRELALARGSLDEPRLAREHLRNIVHSLNPDIQPIGNGLGYGVVPALTRTLQHLEFASDTDDASESLRRSVSRFREHASATSDTLLIALATARRASVAPPERLREYLPAVEDSLTHGIRGRDLDHDGIVGNLPDESGLVQLREQLASLAANEVDPPYKPIGEGYLLGLVREPGGRWVYDFDRKGATRHRASDYR